MRMVISRAAASLLCPAVPMALALVMTAAPAPLRAADPPQGAQTGSGAAVAAPAAVSPADAQAQAKAEMEAYAKLAQPGEHHKQLGNLVGKWKVAGKSWMAPGQPPVEMNGTTETSWILGGHYLQEVHKSSFMGQPFEGRSIDGYDNTTHDYFSTWIDSMGTGVMLFRGSCDDPCKVLTEVAEGPDPMTGKVMKTKIVTTFVDHDTYRYEMYMVGMTPDGQDAKVVKVMELTAKRQK
jgi:hypothetical protein